MEKKYRYSYFTWKFFRRPSVLYSLINSLVSKFYFLKVGELFIGD